MCYAVIEVRYRNKTEPDQLIALHDAETFSKRTDELMRLETVERVTVFRPAQTHKRVSSWETVEHPL